ncbi:MAG: alkene reductase [Planctomycetaceae bacterium]|nr:alkene reductase [Planctomycetaceae bacterium]
MSTLFDPLCIGSLEVPNRIFMAPLTRCRAEPGDVPGDLIATHYAQRATAGLLIAEATMAIAGNCAFMGAPGVHSAEQVAGWAKVTSAVHAAGGRIYLQLWHGGRACHSLLNAGSQPVAPSAIAISEGAIWTPEGEKPYETPRALRDDEIPAIIEGFRRAADNARRAGFDGVEVHGANGYLLDQFLRDGTNQRSGPYGGSVSNRARLMFEIVDAAASVFGHGRVGLRISPLNSYNSMIDSDPVAITRHVAEQASSRGLSYLHVMRSDFLGRQRGDVLPVARASFRGALVANMGYTPDEAAAAVATGSVDAVAFGTAFLANPDLPARIRAGAPLNSPDPQTFYAGGAKGYIDYPALHAV